MTRGRSKPIRTCTGCGQKAPQADLARFHVADGALAAGRGNGRGAYTCRRITCFEKAVAHRSFNRTLRRTVRVEQTLARLYTQGMSDSTDSRARLHDLDGLGRSVPAKPGEAGPREASASPRRLLTDASSIAEETPRHPSPPSSRPATGDSVEALI